MKKQIIHIIRDIWYILLIKPKISFLRFFGAKIGINSRLYNSLSNFDLRFINFLNIGNNVIIAKGTMIFTHDASVKNMKKFNIIKEEFKEVKIEDNVFIGAGSIILPGITIGENTIIGAGSVVTRDIPKNCIAAGNPAKVIKNLK